MISSHIDVREPVQTAEEFKSQAQRIVQRLLDDRALQADHAETVAAKVGASWHPVH
jgi:hypothetical protein